jgi:hypothetical protein
MKMKKQYNKKPYNSIKSIPKDIRDITLKSVKKELLKKYKLRYEIIRNKREN